jgi:hypothetical protein
MIHQKFHRNSSVVEFREAVASVVASVASVASVEVVVEPQVVSP